MKIAVILNPSSGGYKNSENLKEEILNRFSEFDTHLFIIDEQHNATDFAQKAVNEGADLIIAAGGDGTLIGVITGIVGTNVKFGIIPIGTGNMLAANLGIPRNINDAIEIIKTNNSKKIDLGKINDKYFAFMAGCGFDAKIIQETSPEKKKRFGLLAYFIQGFKHALTAKYAKVKIKLDNDKIVKKNALMVVIANGGNIIGELFSIAPHASICDGLLDVIIIAPKRFMDYVNVFLDLCRKTEKRTSGKIFYYKAKRIQIESIPSIPVQADGDIIGNTPINIEVLPAAIDIIIPENPVNHHIQELLDEHLKRVFRDIMRNFINLRMSLVKTVKVKPESIQDDYANKTAFSVISNSSSSKKI